MADHGNEREVDQTILGERNADCRVCGRLRQEEKIYVDRLADFLNSLEGRSLYGTSQGLCLRHLGLLVKCIPSAETVDFLLREAARRLQEIETNLKSYGQKLESRNRHNCTPEEKGVDRRALIRIAGAKTLSFPFG
jgi:hypothetical protein